MKTVGDILQLTSQFLKGKKHPAHRRVAEEILAHVLRTHRLDLYLQHDRPLIEQEVGEAREILKRVAGGYPVEYIVGLVDFLGCKIEVDSRVLIPRPETEIMAHRAIQYIKKLEGEVSVLDLCSGSGCLGIAIKRHCPNANVTLADISLDALEVARKNAEGNRVDVEIVHSDLTEKVKGPFDVVICNPPYISLEAYEKLDSSVKDHEPKIALVGGVKGTEFYEKLSTELEKVLKDSAKCFFEIGYDQKEAIEQIFKKSDWELEVHNDWAGLARFVEICYSPKGVGQGV